MLLKSFFFFFTMLHDKISFNTGAANSSIFNNARCEVATISAFSLLDLELDEILFSNLECLKLFSV